MKIYPIFVFFTCPGAYYQYITRMYKGKNTLKH